MRIINQEIYKKSAARLRPPPRPSSPAIRRTGGGVSPRALLTGGGVSPRAFRTGGGVSPRTLLAGGGVSPRALRTGGGVSPRALRTGGGVGLLAALRCGVGLRERLYERPRDDGERERERLDP